jgi:acyl-CoA synthetase (AMP-forming)/AMP-acid ligase II
VTSPLPAPPVEPAPPVLALRHAAHDPDRVAIADGDSGERLTRGELAARSAAIAAGLVRKGVERGDVVALAMPNCAWWPVIALGVWRAGAALAPLNPAWTPPELARLLALVQPRLAIASRSCAAPLTAGLAAAGVDARVFSGDGLLVGGADAHAEPELAPGDLACVPFSSGTSGMPKGVRLTNANLAVAAAHIATAYSSAGRFDADSVVLGAAPFSAVMGLNLGLLAPLAAGARIVTIPVPRTEAVLESLAAHRVTHTVVAPPVVSELAAAPDVERHDTSRLRFVASGGAHVPATAQLRAGRRLGCLVRQGYGMTEANTISAPMGRPSAPATVGWLGAGTEARLVDPGSRADVPPGEPGELWIRGPQVMDGYHGDPDATAAAITSDGWLRTGDLVRIRDDGQLVIEDRLKELIKVRGVSVAPAELELVLREHPAVRDAAVVGRPDAVHGEVPVAWVVLAAPAGADELIAFAGARLSRHKRLHDVRIVDSLPRLPSGKLQRRVLRATTLRRVGVRGLHRRL